MIGLCHQLDGMDAGLKQSGDEDFGRRKGPGLAHSLSYVGMTSILPLNAKH